MIPRIVAHLLSRSRLCTLLLCGTALLTVGCASVTATRSDGSLPGGSKTAPDRIYIASFAAPAQNLRVDRDGERLVEFQQQFAAKLRDSLAQQIDRNLVPTEKLIGSAIPPRSNAWLIVGRFDRIEQGSRALRALVGFGLGGTKVDTTAVIYDLSTPQPTPIMSIQTTGGSNSAPGTVVNLTGLVSIGPAGLAIAAGTTAITGLGGVAFGAGTGAIPGLSDDARRTAREITAHLSTTFYERGWIPERQVMRPKEPGSGTIRLSEPGRPDENES